MFQQLTAELLQRVNDKLQSWFKVYHVGNQITQLDKNLDPTKAIVEIVKNNYYSHDAT